MFSLAGYLVVAFTTHAHGVAPLIIAFALLGAGIGAAETVSNELIIAAAPPEKAGAASAVSETAYELGAVLGTTILGGIITAFYRSSLVVPQGVPAAAAERARETLAGAFSAAEGLPVPIGQALQHAAADAFGTGVMVTSLIGGFLVDLCRSDRRAHARAPPRALTCGRGDPRLPIIWDPPPPSIRKERHVPCREAGRHPR